MSDTVWSPGLARLPGVTYSPPPGVSLPRSQRAATPRVSRYEFDGEIHGSLSWDTRGGSTSASPAARHFSDPPGRDAPAHTILQQLHAGLSLPGTPSDYHFAIQRALDALWSRRRDDPEAVAALEGLCLLDIEIVEAYPDAFRTEHGFYALTAPRLLIQLYEGAGDLEAALATARRVAPLLNGTADVEGLQARLARLHEEDAP